MTLAVTLPVEAVEKLLDMASNVAASPLLGAWRQIELAENRFIVVPAHLIPRNFEFCRIAHRLLVCS